MSEKLNNKTCGECRYFEVDEIAAKCEKRCVICGDDIPACEYFEMKEPTVFDRITASPEVLARKVVYPVFDYGNSIGVKIRGYKSPFLDDIYPIWNLAFEKTLAKLKEVGE